ncbi:MAG TPA: hypothetical protein VNL77_00655, partial [Roseiflexaceae bacterium]|nr:hypothetical protein [Roseiflexaceae bacterium]
PAPTAAPTAPAATAAPAAPAAATAPAAEQCVTFAGMPVYDGALCVDHDTDEDDGVITHENTYTTPAGADDVRRFYEAAFVQNGWTVREFEHDADDPSWKYTVAQGQRTLKVRVKAELQVDAVVTEVTIAES